MSVILLDLKAMVWVMYKEGDEDIWEQYIKGHHVMVQARRIQARRRYTSL